MNRCSILGMPLFISGYLLVASLIPTRAAPPQPVIDFNRQIRPILSENCFACHGPDDKTRKAKFRLDTKEGAFGELRSGGHALIAGNPEKSELFSRITAHDAKERMPPPDSGKKLTAEQIALVRQW